MPMKLLLIVVLVISVLTLLYFAITEKGPIMLRIVVAVTGAIISLSVLFLWVLSLLALLLIMWHYFPQAVTAEHWQDLLYAALATVGSQFVYEITVEKVILLLFKKRHVNASFATSFVYVLKALVTYVLLLALSGLLLGAIWNRNAVLIIAGVQTLIDFFLDKLTKSSPDYQLR